MMSFTGFPPSARHSHCAVVCEKSMFVFGTALPHSSPASDTIQAKPDTTSPEIVTPGGYDSAYKNDLSEYNFASEAWGVI